MVEDCGGMNGAKFAFEGRNVFKIMVIKSCSKQRDKRSDS